MCSTGTSVIQKDISFLSMNLGFLHSKSQWLSSISNLDFSAFTSQIQPVLKPYQPYILEERFPRREPGLMEENEGDWGGLRTVCEGEDRPEGNSFAEEYWKISSGREPWKTWRRYTVFQSWRGHRTAKCGQTGEVLVSRCIFKKLVTRKTGVRATITFVTRNNHFFDFIEDRRGKTTKKFQLEAQKIWR